MRVTAAPMVVSVEGEAVAAELVGIGAGGVVTFRGVEGSMVAEATMPSGEKRDEARAVRSLRLDELVWWGHPALPRAQTLVLLADGSRLVTAADWSGGASVRIEDDDLVALHDAFDEVSVPRSLVRGLVFVPREHTEERRRLEDEVRAAGGPQDEVWLTNQDRLTGRVVELVGGSLTLSTEVGEARLPLSRVEAVVWGDSRQPPAVSRQPEVVVGLRDGSLLYASRVEGDGDEIAVELAGGARLERGRLGDVVFLQSLGGGRFVYLSDLEPVDYRHVPYLDIEWPWERDRSVLGRPLSAGGEEYLKGLGMHSAARLTYRLDGAYRRLDAAVAIDDSAGRRGSVTFGVYVLRDGRWQEVYTSQIVRGGDGPQPVSVDVRGAQGLTLMVDYADRGDELDRANWLDARLIRN